jgi:hypothetical protein
MIFSFIRSDREVRRRARLLYLRAYSGSGELPKINCYCHAAGGLLVPGGAELRTVDPGGGISMFWHEHWSYFTCDSIERTLLAAGFEVRNLRPAGFGGTIYASPVNTGASGGAGAALLQAAERHHTFVTRAKRAVSHFGDILVAARRDGKTVVFYVSTRAINLLTVTSANLSGYRFFDDNQTLWGSYFPGLPIRIENRTEWAANPPNLTLIMSKSLGTKIQAELEALGRDRSVLDRPT